MLVISVLLPHFSLVIVKVMVMVFNATFNNISVTSISRPSVLLVEKTGVPEDNHYTCR